MQSFFARITVISLFSIFPFFAAAETIKIGVGKQAEALQSMERPQRGDTQTFVLEKFGEPESKTEARGQPPISSWQYPDFKVYFESDIVIHSVLKHRPNTNNTTTNE